MFKSVTIVFFSLLLLCFAQVDVRADLSECEAVGQPSLDQINPDEVTIHISHGNIECVVSGVGRYTGADLELTLQGTSSKQKFVPDTCQVTLLVNGSVDPTYSTVDASPLLYGDYKIWKQDVRSLCKQAMALQP